MIREVEVAMGGGRIEIDLAAIDSTWGLYLATVHFLVPESLPCPSCSALSIRIADRQLGNFDVIDERGWAEVDVKPGQAVSRCFVLRALGSDSVHIAGSVSVHGLPVTDTTRIPTITTALLSDSATFHVTPTTYGAIEARYAAERRAAGDSFLITGYPCFLCGCPDSILPYVRGNDDSNTMDEQ
jgi:hypothetical protein